VFVLDCWSHAGAFSRTVSYDHIIEYLGSCSRESSTPISGPFTKVVCLILKEKYDQKLLTTVRQLCYAAKGHRFKLPPDPHHGMPGGATATLVPLSARPNPLVYQPTDNTRMTQWLFRVKENFGDVKYDELPIKIFSPGSRSFQLFSCAGFQKHVICVIHGELLCFLRSVEQIHQDVGHGSDYCGRSISSKDPNSIPFS
jgi:hypothetical protein